MPIHIIIPAIIGLGIILYFGIRARRLAGSAGLTTAQVDGMQFDKARDVLQFMKEQRIGYVAVEGGGTWEAKDLKQQGIVNLLRVRYFELHAVEQKKYFSDLSADHVSQARELMARRPAGNLRGYRQQLMKLMIYVKDPECLSEIRSELATIQPAVEEEQVRAALDNPPAELDDQHLALLENFLEAHPRFTLARELEAEIARVKGILGGQV